MHSGRQRGGDPRNSGAHVHTACPFNSRHMLFEPQGFGLHGLVTDGTTRESNIISSFFRAYRSDIFFILNTFHYIARNKRVSGGTGGTTAHRCVIDHVA